MKNLFILPLLYALLASPAAAQSYVWPQNGHTYVLISPTDWQSSYSAAVAEGGYLVTINDADEQAWLYNNIPVDEFWLGYNDVANEGTFVWASGQTPTYTNWNSGEPNDSLGEDCAVMMRWQSGKWNDWQCGQSEYGLAEINTTPVPTATPTITPTATSTPTSTPTASPAAVIYRLGEDSDEVWHVGR